MMNESNRRGDTKDMVEITKVVKAHSRYNVLRTSIPAGVRAALGLEEGDELEWTVEPESKRIIAKVRRKEVKQ